MTLLLQSMPPSQLIISLPFDSLSLSASAYSVTVCEDMPQCSQFQ